MHVRQTVIQDRIEGIASKLGISQDEAFLRFSHSILTGQSIHAFTSTDLVDGGEDKQIDVITIERIDDKEAIVYIVQTKNTTSFSSNQLIQMHNGLQWIFNRPKNELNTLKNVRFRDKILEFRAERSELGPSNIQIVVAFITNGRTSELSNEFEQEMRAINHDYDNGAFAKFDLFIWGADELMHQINMLEKKDRKIDVEISIRYDTNNPSLIKYHSEGLKGIICTASAREIARVVNSDTTGSVFDANIRRFLGTRGGVNAGILTTCTDSTESHQFWFLNNGITIVCESFDAVTDPDHPHIKLKHMQIVNGCQTATTLALAEKDGKLAKDTRVLLRIYEAPNSDLIDKIVLTTNNQNKINSRDLRANDPMQVDMERAFLAHGYLYERKLRQYDNKNDIDAKRILPNEIVAQAYLAIVLKKPSDARTHKQKVWGELYDKVFNGSSIEPYIIATLIYRYTQEWIKRSGTTKDSDHIRRKLANNGTFFIARIASFLWMQGDHYNKDRSYLQSKIADLEANSQVMDTYISSALDQLEAIIKGNQGYRSDVDRAMKSTTLNTEIDRALYSPVLYKK
jgi:AIPR protein